MIHIAFTTHPRLRAFRQAKPFCRSLGLIVPPRVRFLQRLQKKMAASSSVKSKDETGKALTNLGGDSEQESEDSADDIPNTAHNTKKKMAKDEVTFQFGKEFSFISYSVFSYCCIHVELFP